MQLIEKIAPFYIAFILIEVTYSYFTQKKVYSLFDSIANISTGAMSRLGDVLVLSASFLIFEAIRDYVGIRNLSYDFSNPFTIDNSFPFVGIHAFAFCSWFLVFILIDLVYYTFHRFSHEINFLWAAHVVHHSSEEFNLSVALRQTMLRNVFYFFFVFPLVFLNISYEVILICDALNRTY